MSLIKSHHWLDYVWKPSMALGTVCAAALVPYLYTGTQAPAGLGTLTAIATLFGLWCRKKARRQYPQ